MLVDRIYLKINHLAFVSKGGPILDLVWKASNLILRDLGLVKHVDDASFFLSGACGSLSLTDFILVALSATFFGIHLFWKRFQVLRHLFHVGSVLVRYAW